MEELKKQIGWPEGVPLPTVEETEEAVREGERLIVQMLDDLKDKLRGPTSEMLNTIINI